VSEKILVDRIVEWKFKSKRTLVALVSDKTISNLTTLLVLPVASISPISEAACSAVINV